MKTSLRTDMTIAQVCEGFEYDDSEGKGLYGLGGRLLIQPEYQRNYIYESARMEAAVVESVLKKYPIGLLYFNRADEDRFEVLDGQQRITSLGRFLKHKFSVHDAQGMPQYFDSLSDEQRRLILDTRLTICICEGEESEIKDWFRTINIAGIALNAQEIANSVYSGSFVTAAKAIFSNSSNTNLQKWSTYVRGAANRQDFLRTALEWPVGSTDRDKLDQHMSLHRRDDNADELRAHFDAVIDWIELTFIAACKEMCGLDRGRLYSTYHARQYDPAELARKIDRLYADEAVTNPRGIFEYVLGDCSEPKLLNIRVFDEKTKRVAYARQTDAAKRDGVSNCPMCAAAHLKNSARIWKLGEMDADHVTAWSRGGETSLENCQLPCKPHNRSKGNA